MNTTIKNKFLIPDNLLILNNVTIKEAANGIIKLVKNAEDLLDIADVLMKAKKEERAIVLIVAALEEASKVNSITTELFKKETVAERNSVSKLFWRKWTHHSWKQQLALASLHEDFGEIIGSFDSKRIDELTKISKEEQKFLEKARKLGFYVDFVDNKFMSPLESFKKNKYVKANLNKLLKKIRVMVEGEKEWYSVDPNTCVSRLKTIYAFFNYANKGGDVKWQEQVKE
jgi:AbiV family abortive infection protein